MPTICHDFQLLLVAGQPLSPEHKHHLAECADCRQFQRLLAAGTRVDDGPEPPASLDRAVLAYAREQAPAPRLMLVTWRRVAVAAAALAAICLLVLAVNRNDAPAPGQPNLAHDSTVPTVVDSIATDTDSDDLLDWEMASFDSQMLRIETELALLQNLSDTTDNTEPIL